MMENIYRLNDDYCLISSNLSKFTVFCNLKLSTWIIIKLFHNLTNINFYIL